jgi:fused signal recognition particle receptor
MGEAAVDMTNQGWFSRLKAGLSKTSDRLTDGISDIFTKRKLDTAMLEELEELLIMSDIGAQTATRLVEDLSNKRFDKEVTDEEVREILAEKITSMLRPVEVPLDVDRKHQPQVILVVGVNGNGKTTTIGKMATQLKGAGWNPMLAAGDTFRAAAVEQLKIWGDRSQTPVLVEEENADPASVAYKALDYAREHKHDVLMIDTAGRLQNRKDLMAQLEKMNKVLKKLDDTAPHDVILVLDATTGQNAISQLEAFQETVGVTGIIITKLDGTAKGGIVLALAQQFGLPIHAIGVGEGIEDLDTFDAEHFARNLVGLD